MAKKVATKDAIDILHEDHQKVRDLFYSFFKAEGHEEKEKLKTQLLLELYIHAKVEEEHIYPLLDEEGEEGEELKGEAENEHLVVKFLMADVASSEDLDDSEVKSKMLVLCELVEHHVREEETEMFEKLREGDADLESIAKDVMATKEQLLAEGLPSMKVNLSVGGATSKKAGNGVVKAKTDRHRTVVASSRRR